MYTHTITERNFYNIYIYIYICTHLNFLIYGISMKLLFFCNYAHTEKTEFEYIYIYMNTLYIIYNEYI